MNYILEVLRLCLISLFEINTEDLDWAGEVTLLCDHFVSVR